ncbi:permease for cytosine/purines, uracil, thiamine, allantoin-domain-containing protein [Russula aff. rugulosa BPL654]|nr:permease for cytosine/purines, uracil, thiamine, allantoin-domain-containing protein [Russula aff. rugulosa BPL654]
MNSPTIRPHGNNSESLENLEAELPTWTTSATKLTHSISEKLLDWGVETRDRTESHFIKIFFVWLSANMNILPFASGSLGPVTFGLGLRDSCLVILFFNLFCAVAPAYLTTWGPKLGFRQLCASRYTFGYYGAMVPGLLAVADAFGFCILNSILGGQALSSIANISWTVGIVIIAVISLVVSFGGLRILNCTDLQFGATIAGYMIPWSALSSDYTAYFHPRISLQCLGAAAAISAPFVPEWKAGYSDGDVGGLLNAMLSPIGKFGKALMVHHCPTIYSMGMAFQTFIPPLVAVPRYVFSVFATITILSIMGNTFYATLSNFLGIIGYWTAAWVSAIFVEHLYFRKGKFSLYDTQSWNIPSQLPLGAAALGACALSFALTGDIGFEFALAITALLYIPLRHLEKHWRGV